MSDEAFPDGKYKMSDEVWRKIEPLLPPEPPKPKGGRPRMSDRSIMEAILYIFCTGCGWHDLPKRLGSASTVYRRFQEWQKAGLYQRMWIYNLLTYEQMKALVWYGRQ